MRLSEKKEMINIGKVTTTVGLRGEVRVMMYSGKDDNIRKGQKIYYETLKGEQHFIVESLRKQKDMFVVKFSELSDINAAEELRNIDLYINEDDLVPLPEGRYYVRDLIGLEVYDSATAQVIGHIKDLKQNTAQGLYVVEKPDGGEVMIPDVEAFVRGLDISAGRLTVELIPGFLD